jgi:hypothetical protein
MVQSYHINGRLSREEADMLGIRRITGAADLAPAGQPGSWVSDAARQKFTAA